MDSVSRNDLAGAAQSAPGHTPACLAGRSFRRTAICAAAILSAALLLTQVRPTDARGESSAHPVCSRAGGLIDYVGVTHGCVVKAGQVLIKMNPADLDHEIESTECKLALISDEIEADLQAANHGQVERLADRRQLVLKRKSIDCDLRYLRARRQSLELRAPVSGRVVTRYPEHLVGRLAAIGDELLQIEPVTGATES